MKIEYEIHMGKPASEDPETGKELPPRIEKFTSWDDALERLFQKRAGMRVFFVERKTDKAGEVHESGVHVPLRAAREMMAQGVPDMTLQAEAIVRGMKGDDDSAPATGRRPVKGKA